eukprot:TRINITY_DN25949_c0_g1_i1.p1 TRINITY_DN25949_c0_g1~~TRINITY_DN25949_c0_g1_i1.p1  ORF type:complete len:2023 (-),score=448.15 TRINITY_DN25949_c0_g1_i1:215-6283(-)
MSRVWRKSEGRSLQHAATMPVRDNCSREEGSVPSFGEIAWRSGLKKGDSLEVFTRNDDQPRWERGTVVAAQAGVLSVKFSGMTWGDGDIFTRMSPASKRLRRLRWRDLQPEPQAPCGGVADQPADSSPSGLSQTGGSSSSTSVCELETSSTSGDAAASQPQGGSNAHGGRGNAQRPAQHVGASQSEHFVAIPRKDLLKMCKLLRSGKLQAPDAAEVLETYARHGIQMGLELDRGLTDKGGRPLGLPPREADSEVVFHDNMPLFDYPLSKTEKVRLLLHIFEMEADEKAPPAVPSQPRPLGTSSSLPEKPSRKLWNAPLTPLDFPLSRAEKIARLVRLMDAKAASAPQGPTSATGRAVEESPKPAGLRAETMPADVSLVDVDADVFWPCGTQEEEEDVAAKLAADSVSSMSGSLGAPPTFEDPAVSEGDACPDAVQPMVSRILRPTQDLFDEHNNNASARDYGVEALSPSPLADCFDHPSGSTSLPASPPVHAAPVVADGDCEADEANDAFEEPHAPLRSFTSCPSDRQQFLHELAQEMQRDTKRPPSSATTSSSAGTSLVDKGSSTEPLARTDAPPAPDASSQPTGPSEAPLSEATLLEGTLSSVSNAGTTDDASSPKVDTTSHKLCGLGPQPDLPAAASFQQNDGADTILPEILQVASAGMLDASPVDAESSDRDPSRRLSDEDVDSAGPSVTTPSDGISESESGASTILHEAAHHESTGTQPGAFPFAKMSEDTRFTMQETDVVPLPESSPVESHGAADESHREPQSHAEGHLSDRVPPGDRLREAMDSDSEEDADVQHGRQSPAGDRGESERSASEPADEGISDLKLDDAACSESEDSSSFASPHAESSVIYSAASQRHSDGTQVRPESGRHLPGVVGSAEPEEDGESDFMSPRDEDLPGSSFVSPREQGSVKRGSDQSTSQDAEAEPAPAGEQDNSPAEDTTHKDEMEAADEAELLADGPGVEDDGKDSSEDDNDVDADSLLAFKAACAHALHAAPQEDDSDNGDMKSGTMLEATAHAAGLEQAAEEATLVPAATKEMAVAAALPASSDSEPLSEETTFASPASQQTASPAAHGRALEPPSQETSGSEVSATPREELSPAAGSLQAAGSEPAAESSNSEDVQVECLLTPSVPSSSQRSSSEESYVLKDESMKQPASFEAAADVAGLEGAVTAVVVVPPGLPVGASVSSDDLAVSRPRAEREEEPAKCWLRRAGLPALPHDDSSPCVQVPRPQVETPAFGWSAETSPSQSAAAAVLPRPALRRPSVDFGLERLPAPQTDSTEDAERLEQDEEQEAVEDLPTLPVARSTSSDDAGFSRSLAPGFDDTAAGPGMGTEEMPRSIDTDVLQRALQSALRLVAEDDPETSGQQEVRDARDDLESDGSSAATSPVPQAVPDLVFGVCHGDPAGSSGETSPVPQASSSESAMDETRPSTPPLVPAQQARDEGFLNMDVLHEGVLKEIQEWRAAGGLELDDAAGDRSHEVHSASITASMETMPCRRSTRVMGPEDSPELRSCTQPLSSELLLGKGLPGFLDRTGVTNSIDTRMRWYEAACKAGEWDLQGGEGRSSPRFLTTASGTTATTGTISSSDSHPMRAPRKSQMRPVLCKVSEVTEQCVLKRGLAALEEELVQKSGVDVTEGIDAKWLGAPLLRRLLSKELELKSCMENDVCAAQSDLKHLTTEQLLTLRLDALELLTASASHSARSSFLQIAEKHLFQKFSAACMLRRSSTTDIRQPSLHGLDSSALFSLGVYTCLVLGALQMLAAGEATAKRPLPEWWIFGLRGLGVGDFRAALLHTRRLCLRLVTSTEPDFSPVPPGELVAVIRDQSRGQGTARMMYWEVVLVDPHKDDAFAELGDAQKLLVKQSDDDVTDRLRRVSQRDWSALEMQRVQSQQGSAASSARSGALQPAFHGVQLRKSTCCPARPSMGGLDSQEEEDEESEVTHSAEEEVPMEPPPDWLVPGAEIQVHAPDKGGWLDGVVAEITDTQARIKAKLGKTWWWEWRLLHSPDLRPCFSDSDSLD